MELKVRSRNYRLLALKHSLHDNVLTWKKDRLLTTEFPGEVYQQAVRVLQSMFLGFDMVTIPAPSFHTYATHPLMPVATELASALGVEFKLIFPEKSGKTRMGWHGSLQKKVQEITIKSGLFVLILDDILTTGHTGRVSCEAVAKCGSYPCFLALSEGK